MLSESHTTKSKVNKTLTDDELEQIVRLDKRLGGGAHGNVFQGYDVAHGCFVAIKEIPYLPNNNNSYNSNEENKDYEFDNTDHCVNTDGNKCNSSEHNDSAISTVSDAASAIIQEIKILERACHTNLVRYYGARRSNVGVELIMEYVSGGSLEKLLLECGSVRESVAKRYVMDILDGLIYLHNVLHVCHRDIKPGNVLLTSEGQCKLTDFGVSKLLMEHSGKLAFMHTTIGTPWYMAPEVISGGIEDDSDIDSDSEKCKVKEPEENYKCNDKERFSQLQYNNDYDDGVCCKEEREANTPTKSSTPFNSENSVRTTGTSVVTTSLPVSSSSHTESTPIDTEEEEFEEEEEKECGYGTSADIWSLGVTLYEMVSGIKPFGHHLHNGPAIMYAITTHASHPPQLPESCNASWELQQFIHLCLMHDAKLRPTAKELRSHVWIVYDNNKRNGDANSKMHECNKSNRWAEPVSGNKSKPDSGLQLLDAIDVLQTQNITKQTKQTQKLDIINVCNDMNIKENKKNSNNNIPCRRETKGKSASKGGFCTRDGCFVDIDALQ